MRFATKIGLSVALVTLLGVPLLGVAVFYQASVIMQERSVHEQIESAKSVMRNAVCFSQTILDGNDDSIQRVSGLTNGHG